jgi:hypothetical protein
MNHEKAITLHCSTPELRLPARGIKLLNMPHIINSKHCWGNGCEHFKSGGCSLLDVSQLKLGSTVELNSGSVLMVVDEIDYDQRIAVCLWHDNEKKLHEEKFKIVCLTLIAS